MPPNQTLTPSQGEQVIPTSSGASAPSSSAASTVKIEKNDDKTSRQSWNLPIVLGIITWVLTLLLLLLFLPTSYWLAWRGLVARFILQSAYIDVGDHVFADNLFIVRQAKLAKPGYIGLYEASEYESGFRDALALTKPLFPGTYEFLQLHINPDKWIDRSTSSSMQDIQFYVVMYYFDGDIVGVEQVENIKGSIALDGLGQPIITKLTIRKY